MSSTRIAERYARAFFELARDNDEVDKVISDVSAIRTLTMKSRDFHEFLINPGIKQDTRIHLIGELFESRISPLSHRFLLFLARKKRLAHLNEICLRLEGLYDLHKGILKVQIDSAEELSIDQRQAFILRFQRKFHKAIQPNVRIKPDLIAGFTVRAGDTIYDCSVAGMLETFKKNIIKA